MCKQAVGQHSHTDTHTQSMTIPKGQSWPQVKRTYASGSKLPTCVADMHLFQIHGAHHGQPWFPLMLVLWDTTTRVCPRTTWQPKPWPTGCSDHHGLLHKLENYGISGKLTHELQTSSAADLTRWSLRVVHQEQYPQDLVGVPKSVLGLVLFPVFIIHNDIADKTYSAASKWQMDFHPSKCKTLHISRPPKPLLTTNNLYGQQISAANSAKYLWATLQTYAWTTLFTMYTIKQAQPWGSYRETSTSAIQITTQAYRTCQTTAQVHGHNLGFTHPTEYQAYRSRI